MSEPIKINVADVIFREDLYPRIEKSAVTVQQYAEDLTVLPPIEVNQNNELIDGWHRWTAHKKEEAKTIEVIITPTSSDAELLELAIERNSSHGLQLSQADKRDMARRIYQTTPEKKRDEKKKHLAKILSVSERTVRGWLSRIDKDAKEARDKKIFGLWLACWTQEEIAAEVGVNRDALAKDSCFVNIGKSANFHKTDHDADADSSRVSKADRAAAEHATDFTPPIYNVWKQQEKTAGAKHFGNSEVRWLDNLLYLYTEPFDVVFDPFAGSGSTIDLCKKRHRRYYVSDRNPIVERADPGADQIRKHDITSGLPRLPWKDARLVYLDPPYWKQAEGKYSKDPEDLANMSLEDFTKTLSSLINEVGKKMTSGVIAMIMQPTQWNAPERQFTDHVADMIRLVKLPVKMRIQAPYESQQCTAQMVEWAKENKSILVLSREIVVWGV